MARIASSVDTPAEPQAVTFVPITHGHLPLVARWLAEPHVSGWWGDPDEQLALVAGDIDEPLMDGYLFFVGDRPAGYVQSYPAAAWPGHPFGDLAVEGAMAVDMFLGEPGLVGQGHGARALAAFAGMLFTEGASRVLIDPDLDNAAAIRAYVSAGFIAVGAGVGTEGPALIMVCENGASVRTPPRGDLRPV